MMKSKKAARASVITLHLDITVNPEDLRALHDAIFPKVYLTLKAPKFSKKDQEVLAGLVDRPTKHRGD